MGRRASQRAFDQIWMHFLLYSFTHYQEPILPILSHLQYLICTSHQSSGTDLGYTSFIFLEAGSESTDLHNSLKSSSSKSRLFAFTILGLCPAVRRSTDSVYVWGDVLVSSQLPRCELEGAVQRQRGGAGTAEQREWWDARAPASALAAGREAWCQQLDPTPSRSTVSHLFYNSYPYSIPFRATVIKIGSRSTLIRFLNFQLKL